MKSAPIWALPSLLILAVLVRCPAKETSNVSSSGTAVQRLAEQLMDGYNKAVRPVRDWRQATTVYIDIVIYAIIGVDEKNQMLTTYIWYNQSWVDEFLTWNPMEFENVTRISFSTQNIWTPDICVVEFVAVEKSLDIPYVYINNEGKVFNNKPIQIVTACNLNIYYFPFDIQNCSLTFTSWIHSIQDINVSLWRTPDEIKTDDHIFRNYGEWDLIYVLPRYSIFYEQETNFGEITFNIVMKRRPLFYVVNLLLPSMFLVIMDIIGYYLPPECGERISFKITLLLGYSVFLIIVSDTLPATAIGTPLVGVYFIVCMALLLISLTESIFIVRIVHKQHLQPRVPEWVKKLVLERMPWLLCIKEPKMIGASYSSRSDISWNMENSDAEKMSKHSIENTEENEMPGGEILTKDEVLGILDGIQKEVASIRNYLEKSDEHEITKEWLQVGYILDMLLFRIYLVALLAYICSMVVMWSNWQLA
ncbi:5-hydroxytryptamine receptor 3A-like [Spea bombifrons]|uniref:5-hydroxytryptamine receptor 3A-like n=1 Tax=Spea bombifrons TaxID=233779 RepID=UPI0023493207|nr:5-hydroxytryptamine receptor 3A-like [Spea bombifrons]